MIKVKEDIIYIMQEHIESFSDFVVEHKLTDTQKDVMFHSCTIDTFYPKKKKIDVTILDEMFDFNEDSNTFTFSDCPFVNIDYHPDSITNYKFTNNTKGKFVSKSEKIDTFIIEIQDYKSFDDTIEFDFSNLSSDSDIEMFFYSVPKIKIGKKFNGGSIYLKITPDIKNFELDNPKFNNSDNFSLKLEDVKKVKINCDLTLMKNLKINNVDELELNMPNFSIYNLTIGFGALFPSTTVLNWKDDISYIVNIKKVKKFIMNKIRTLNVVAWKGTKVENLSIKEIDFLDFPTKGSGIFRQVTIDEPFWKKIMNEKNTLFKNISGFDGYEINFTQDIFQKIYDGKQLVTVGTFFNIVSDDYKKLDTWEKIPTVNKLVISGNPDVSKIVLNNPNIKKIEINADLNGVVSNALKEIEIKSMPTDMLEINLQLQDENIQRLTFNADNPVKELIINGLAKSKSYITTVVTINKLKVTQYLKIEYYQLSLEELNNFIPKNSKGLKVEENQFFIDSPQDIITWNLELLKTHKKTLQQLFGKMTQLSNRSNFSTKLYNDMFKLTKRASCKNQLLKNINALSLILRKKLEASFK